MLNPISSIKLVLLTGVSGAGHSTALKILEDYGFTAVDNLPLALVDPLIALEVETGGRSIAIGLDAAICIEILFPISSFFPLTMPSILTIDIIFPIFFSTAEWT